MNLTAVHSSGRHIATALVAIVVLCSAPALAVDGPEFRLPNGPTLASIKYTSGLVLNIDGRGIDANGYRPLRITVSTWPANKPLTADRQVRVVFRLRGDDYWHFTQVSQVIELPEGSTTITATVLVPQTGDFRSLAIETFEGGEKLKELSQDPVGWPSANNSNWTEARPATLFIDSHAPSRDERFGQIQAFESNATDAKTYTLPDVRHILSLFPEVIPSWTRRGSPPNPAVHVFDAGPITDTALLTLLKARSRAEMLSPAELPDRWIELSQFDLAIISLADLQDMATSRPKKLAALRGWLSTGPLLIVYGCGDDLAKLLELERLLDLPPLAVDGKISPGPRGWTVPTAITRVAALTLPDEVGPDGVPIPPPSQSAESLAPPDATPLTGPPPFVFRIANTGCLVAIGSENPFPGQRVEWNWIFKSVSESHWQSFQRTGFSQQRTNRDYWKLLIPGVGEAPVLSYLLLVSLFAVVIGPVNYLLLDRARRLYLLLVTVPIGAVLVTTSLFAFAVVSDGLTMRLRIRSYSDLDQQTGRAAVWSRQSYYAAMAPSRGLHFPDDTTVFPATYEPSDSRNRKSTLLVWDGEQQLRGGYLASRTATQFIVCRATTTPAKLIVTEATAPSPPKVENRLATTIKYLLLRDSRGNYFAGQAIPDKANIVLTAVETQDAKNAMQALAKNVEPVEPNGYDGEQQNNSLFNVLGDRRWRYASGLDASAGDPLMSHSLLEANISSALFPTTQPPPPGSYIAIVESSPLVITGIGPVKEEASLHVIRGRY